MHPDRTLQLEMIGELEEIQNEEDELKACLKRKCVPLPLLGPSNKPPCFRGTRSWIFALSQKQATLKKQNKLLREIRAGHSCLRAKPPQCGTRVCTLRKVRFALHNPEPSLQVDRHPIFYILPGSPSLQEERPPVKIDWCIHTRKGNTCQSPRIINSSSSKSWRKYSISLDIWRKSELWECQII